MEEKLERILAEIGEVKRAIEIRRTPWWERIFWAIEKMLIPLAIAAVAFYGNSAVTKISEGQLELARSSVDDRKEEFRRTMQGKYVELFYADIASGDQSRQRTALGLLSLMDPPMALELSQFVVSSASVSQTIKVEAETTTRQIQADIQREATVAKGPLTGYVVGVYFLAGDPASGKLANEIRSQLINQNLGATVRLYTTTAEFMTSVVAPTDLEVRYEEGIEDSQAKVISSALAKPPLARIAQLRLVGNTTRNFLSVFVPS